MSKTVGPGREKQKLGEWNRALDIQCGGFGQID